jgi:phosphohistidine phosphatase
MPRLILLRHATAERARPRETDHERTLTRGGQKEAKAAGHVLAQRGEAIDLVLSSDSQRTRETWDSVAPEIDAKPKIRFLRSLYEADSYLPALRSEGGNATCVLVVGHNPAMHVTAIEAAESLSGRDGQKLASGFPKGAIAIFDFNGEWTSLQPGRMRLVAFIQAGGK